MDAIVLAGIAIIIFGGGQFILGLIFMWIRTLVDNHRMRVHNRMILAAVEHRYYNHI